MILTLDLGTTATKAVVWGPDGPRGAGRAEVPLEVGPGGRCEQDPGCWWPAVLAACAEARRADPAAWEAVEGIGFATARQTVVPVTAAGEPLGAALVWSDRRAGTEAAALAETAGGSEAVRRRTGTVLDAGAVAAKVAWLAAHDAGRLEAARYLLGPRDLLAWWLTGVVATDDTVASSSGLYRLDGTVDPDLAGPVADRLPDVVPAAAVVGQLRADPAAALGLAPGLPVVLGAGDRACEVLGAGADPAWPMVSWGTTANLSVPRAEAPGPPPPGLQCSRGALGGSLVEGGLAGAGSTLGWLASLCGRDVASLLSEAGGRPPGASGVVATAWLGGARAPWWRPDARGAFVGLDPSHGPADLARAALEAVAFDLVRCLAAAGGAPDGLVVAGAGAGTGPWRAVLAGVSGLALRRRRSVEGASVGAALLASTGLGAGYRLDDLNPVVGDEAPDPALVDAYVALRPVVDAVAVAVAALPATGAVAAPAPAGPAGLPDSHVRD